MTPKRIQLCRTKGWRKSPGAIVVARPSRWGNPFSVGDVVQTDWPEAGQFPMTAENVVEAFRYLMGVRLEFPTWENPHTEDVAWTQRWHDDLAELRGHDLACWCPLDAPCHADVLLELANALPEVA